MDHCEPCQAENPCYQCGCTESCDCVTPAYTNTSICGDRATTTDCVVSNAETDTCVGIVKGTTILTSVINKIIVYVKNTLTRLTPLDTSITITPTNDACDDKARIGVRISQNAGNILSLTPTGLLVPTPTPFDLAPAFCPVLESTFAGQEQNQVNTINTTTYDFLSLRKPGTGCDAQLISPPTGFAVTGNTRVSAFGKMEWFATLTLANASAVAGETVLIYNDTIENLQIKNGVNYVGVGIHSIGNLTGLPPSTNFISNLIIGSVSLNGTYTITTEGVTVTGQADLQSITKWKGGRFIGQSSAVMVKQSSELSYAYCSTYLEITGNATVSFCRIEDTKAEIGGYYAVAINNTSGGAEIDAKSTFSNNYVSSVNNQASYLITRTTQNCSVVTNNTFKSIGKTALFVHSGGVNENTIGFVANNNISNVGSEPAVILYDIAGALNLLRDSTPFFVGNNVYSKNGIGVKSISTGLKSCNILSTNNYGLVISNEEEDSYNVNIVDCTVESKNNKALFAQDNIYIVGGTFTSRLNSSAGNPIYIEMDTSARNFYIAGAKTIARSTLAYGIKNGPTALTLKVTNCIFLNENLAGTVLGIHHTGIGGNITLSPIIVDAYMNIT